MPATLVSRSLPGKPAKTQFDKEATLGRSRTNTVVVPEHFSSVSNNHARIRYDDELASYVLEDLESANGTRLDGTRVHEPQRLEGLHVITLGRQIDYVFRDLAAVPAAAHADAPAAAPAPKAAAPQKAPASPAPSATVAERAPETTAAEAVSDRTAAEPAPGSNDKTRVSKTLQGTRVERSPGVDDATRVDAPLGKGTRVERPGGDAPLGKGTRIERPGGDAPVSDKTKVEDDLESTHEEEQP